jgi:hypothetical protein
MTAEHQMTDDFIHTAPPVKSQPSREPGYDSSQFMFAADN